ncbi:DUF4190 domain-containing protein [Arthrobacter deserti]|uniref:DUF4190 domain-containing protein n=1 Tax=Arthrobacter deserti TaxID=1742687 RepID=A0ABX1JSX5_9MICC|nr:DUF4190 domain-containing protein [Arthrobacter deserti]
MAGPEQGNPPPFNDPTNPAWSTDPYAKKPDQPAPPQARGMPAAPYGEQPGPDARQGAYSGPGYAPLPFEPFRPEKRGMSTAALVAGIVSLVTVGTLFIPQILAIVFGHLALRREPSGRAMALTGLIMGYAVAGLWAVLLFLVAVGAMFGSTAP